MALNHPLFVLLPTLLQLMYRLLLLFMRQSLQIPRSWALRLKAPCPETPLPRKFAGAVVSTPAEERSFIRDTLKSSL